MSHELRTPLNGVLGMTELVLESDLSEQQREYLTIATSSAAEPARPSSTRSWTSRRSRRADADRVRRGGRRGPLLAEVVRSVALAAHQKCLDIAFVADESLPVRARFDPHRVRQVLVNLLGNAVKFTERGGVTLRARLEGEAQGEARLVMLVEDTGIGIAPERQAAIFAPFTQADGSTSRRFGGTGLGLTITARLLALMNGSLWLTSEPGRGTTFTLEVPVEGVAARVPPTTPGVFGGLRVLVGSDHAGTREALAVTLQRDGAAVSFAATPEELVAQLSRRPLHDLVVLGARIGNRPAVAFLRDARRSKLAVPPVLVVRRSADAAIERGEYSVLGVVSSAIAPVRLPDVAQAARASRGPAAVEPSKPASAPAASHVPQTKRRALLIEDNVVNQKVAAALLDRRGFDVVVASDGHLGVRAFQEGHFDLVLLDIQMPTMDGFQTLAALRAIESEGVGHTPVLALTAHALDEDRERCLAAGMDGYVPKPIVASHLYRAIDDALLAREAKGETVGT